LSYLHVALFDAAAIADAGLVVRNFIRGDRIHPIGMRGERKVKDVFIDRKIPRLERRRFPIVTLAGEVAWLPGLARGSAALISNATETILRVEAREIAD
jgi:tRNA(Ile)-lysidine synthase